MDGSDQTFARTAAGIAQRGETTFGLAATIDATPRQTAPFDHIYMEGVFSPETYRRLLDSLPETRLYSELIHRDAMQADGHSARRHFPLYPERIWFLPRAQRAFWRQLSRELRSRATQDAFKRKFREALEERFGYSIDKMHFYPSAFLVRDLDGYRIAIHRDALSKSMTAQFYLPKDASQAHLGTIFHDGPDGDEALRTKTLGFRPATGYAFPIQLTKSWHSVAQTSAADGERNSLMLTYHVQKGLPGRIRYRANRFFQFVSFLLGR